MFWENFIQDNLPHHLLVNLFYQANDILKMGITKFSSVEMWVLPLVKDYYAY